jgi:hypothetical protein
MKRKPILCLDFDGVIHSYASGWKGPRTIPDAPVPGALEFIVTALQEFDVQIFSSRTRYWGGRRAMRKWLIHWYVELGQDWRHTPAWLRAVIEQHGVETWRDEVQLGVKNIVKRIGFPRHKPPAMVGLDDRVITFIGFWPAISDLKEFKPWNKRG